MQAYLIECLQHDDPSDDLFDTVHEILVGCGVDTDSAVGFVAGVRELKMSAHLQTQKR